MKSELKDIQLEDERGCDTRVPLKDALGQPGPGGLPDACQHS